MTSAKLRLLAVALGLATLPLAACRHSDRYDRYESSAYQNPSYNTNPNYNNGYDNSGGYAANNAGTHGTTTNPSHYNDYNRTVDNSGGYARDNPGTNGANSQTRTYDNSTTYDRNYDSSLNNSPYDRGTIEPGSTSFSRLTGNLSTTLDADFAKAQSAAEKALHGPWLHHHRPQERGQEVRHRGQVARQGLGQDHTQAQERHPDRRDDRRGHDRQAEPRGPGPREAP